MYAEDKDRFQGQLEGHPKLQQMIKAYEQKQQELKAIKASKKGPAKAAKKRKRSAKADVESEAEEVLVTLRTVMHALQELSL